MHFCPQTLRVSPLSPLSLALPGFQFLPSDQRPSSWCGQTHVRNEEDPQAPRYASLYSTTALAGHAVRSHCKFMSNLTLRSLSALLLSRILPPFECLCFKLHFPGCTGLHFPMNVTVIFQLYIFNHSTSTFITSVFVDASSSFICMGIRTLKIGL